MAYVASLGTFHGRASPLQDGLRPLPQMVQGRIVEGLLGAVPFKEQGEHRLSSGDLDGSHTTAIRGSKDVECQGRKKRKTTNAPMRLKKASGKRLK